MDDLPSPTRTPCFGTNPRSSRVRLGLIPVHRTGPGRPGVSTVVEDVLVGKVFIVSC